MKENQKMAKKASRPRKAKKKDIPRFDESIYSKVTLSNLIVYAVHYLLERNIEIALDDVVFACFRLFPQKFALKKYPRLPDSAVVGRHWHYCRSKRYIAANADFGFKLTAKGENLARKTAKTLGVKIPTPEVKVKPSPTKAPKKKTTSPVAVVQTQLPQLKPVEAPTKKAKPTPSVTVKRTQSPQPKTSAATPVKKAKVTPKKKATLPVTVKQTQSPQPKTSVATPVKKAKVTPKKKVTAPVTATQVQIPPQLKTPVITLVKKAKIAPKKKAASPVTEKPTRLTLLKPVKAPTKKAKITRKEKAAASVTAKPTRLPLPKPVKAPTKKAKVTRKEKAAAPVTIKRTQPPQPKPIWREKIIPPEPTVRTVSVRPEKSNLAAQINVSPEAKIRAGKFVRMMEASDAYVQYKKNGEKSNISEFDFRSLLLCTMESSAETLARNVEQFKGYASIHNRRDLIVFLDFCGDKFLRLLSPQKKISAQRKK